ncbi:MAG: bifunctional methylenetetrahydrofolate dehydrogenase/methenyltetrahydrofolate cyclohydrolase FolD [Thermoleophilia bacterium]|nr:bifunctional methylenetetrahydrofolate dehydrogenase/methenyltetrahydrofolate cyclohydrolase FolD [Thermoleophilia bacterium]
MSATVIDGRDAARRVRERVAEGCAAFAARHGRKPGLVGIQVGDDPASEIYQRNKAQQAEEAGMAVERIKLPEGTTQAEMDALLDRLGADDAVDGMLVQLPVPEPLTEPAIAARIAADKDVDGFSPVNIGRLVRGEPCLRPCTPSGVMWLLDDAGVQLEGANAVVIGRSVIVGKPQSLMLLERNATVTITHSRTRDLAAVCREADVIVAAVGVPEMVRGDWVKPGATVIDVGMNRLDDRLCGDVAYDEVAQVAGAITPVPGGVGPMTIAFLLANTLQSAERRMGDEPTRGIIS